MYKLQNNSVKRLVDGASIPFANGNTDYEGYKQWLSEGNIPEPEFTEAELLIQGKNDKLTQIETDFILAEAQSISYLGFNFISGIDSVTSIDGYMRLRRLAGATTHDIWDINGDEHTLSDSEVNGLLLAIGSQASANKFTKKNRKLALGNATTIVEVNII